LGSPAHQPKDESKESIGHESKKGLLKKERMVF